MPIRAELRHFYRGPEWEATRARIITRADGECEHCGKPHNEWVAVTRDGTGRWNRDLAEALIVTPMSILVMELLADLKKPLRLKNGFFLRKRDRKAWADGWRSPWTFRNPILINADPPAGGRIWFIRRSLTVAHLNNTPGDDRDENLAALCERCHLSHDRDYHAAQRAKRKDLGRPILALLSSDEIRPTA